MGIKEKADRIARPGDLFSNLSRADKDYSKILAELATNLIDRRKKLGLSQSELAELCNVSQPMVSQWESADCNFTIRKLVELLDVMNLDLILSFKERSENLFEVKYESKDKINNRFVMYSYQDLGEAA